MFWERIGDLVGQPFFFKEWFNSCGTICRCRGVGERKGFVPRLHINKNSGN